ncbi:MAG: hypothetical protein WD885_00175 [Candidatus Saccharimonadales bacterium]
MAAKKRQTKTTGSRIKKQKEYKSFRISKKIRHGSNKRLPGIFKLVKLSLAPIKKNRKLFYGLILLQFVISIIFVIGIDSISNFLAIKQDIQELFGDSVGKYTQSLTLLGYVLSLGSSNAGSNLQFFIVLIFSLAIIWSIRQVLAGEHIRLRQAFYEGMYPIIPFLLVLLIIGLQLIPATIGSFLLTTVISGGLAITFIEQFIWWVLFGLLTLLSLYMIFSSIFALYIVTLPNMTPLKALRSARGLVLHRRIGIGLRLLGLPALGIFIYVAVLLPSIIAVPVLVVPIFALLSSFGLFFVHSYIYNLYRELL